MYKTVRISEVYAGKEIPKRAGVNAVWHDTRTFPPTVNVRYKNVWLSGIQTIGDSVRVIGGEVLTTNSFRITFNRCVDVVGHQYSTLQLNGSGQMTLTSVTQVSDTVWDFALAPPISPGDTVKYFYTAGYNMIRDCTSGDEVSDQEADITNDLS